MISWIVGFAVVISASAMTSLVTNEPHAVPSVCDPALTSTSDVILEATPNAIYDQLTKFLSVNCSLQQDQRSEFKSVMSVILSKAEDGDKDTFRDVAVVTSHNPDTVEVKDASLGGDVYGRLSGWGAFITAQWRYPGKHIGGRYRCIAYGMDGSGHPVVSAGYASVALGEETIDMLLNRLKEIDSAQSGLTARLTSSEGRVQQLSSHLNAAETKLTKMSKEVTQLQSDKTGLESRLDGFRDGIFETSASFNGKVYLLSRLVLKDLANADLTCRLFGGYLAEIRTKAQNDFLFNFLITQGNLGREQVMLGATDEKTEGQWTYVSSGERVTFTDWKDGANGGRGSNCMSFTGTYRDGHTYNGMTTDLCKSSSLDRFLCEVPAAALKP